MDWKRAALAASALAFSASAVATGIENRKPGAQERIPDSSTAEPRLSFSPALVTAKAPTLSDILDIVLRERPMAAELSGRSTAATGFPKGSEESHVAEILRGFSSDSARANQIAAALVKESRRRKVGSSLLVGVLLTENPGLDPTARSFVGARGLMQVMPFHAGNWGCESRDLFDIESNICHGVAVLADNLMRSHTLPQALLGYNGCVRGTNTPDCFRYPRKVYGQARKSNSAGFATPKVAARSTRRGG